MVAVGMDTVQAGHAVDTSEEAAGSTMVAMSVHTMMSASRAACAVGKRKPTPLLSGSVREGQAKRDWKRPVLPFLPLSPSCSLLSLFFLGSTGNLFGDFRKGEHGIC